MRRLYILGAAGSIVLLLLAICVVVAQNPQGPRIRAAVPSLVAEQPPNPVPHGARLVRGESFSLPAESAGIYSGAAPASSKPAAIELRSGLKLEGQLAAGPIPCQVMFGQIALPIETIRGIRFSDELTADEGGQSHPTRATIILENGDSLTGVPRIDSLRLTTDWGEAIVNLAHLKSLVLTSDGVTWQEHEGRWRLIPTELPKSGADEGSSGATREATLFDDPQLSPPAGASDVPSITPAPPPSPPSNPAAPETGS